MFTEQGIRTKLTVSRYSQWLKAHFSHKKKDDDWDPATGTCGTHAWWVLEALNIPEKDFGDYKLVTANNIQGLLDKLDKGHILSFLHDYNDRKTMLRLHKDNRYGNHEFLILKGGDKYFVTQGFLHAYKHSLIAYTRDEIATMIRIIIEKMSDYENRKHWGDMDAAAFQHYFRTTPFLYPKLPIKPTGRMHNIVLKVDIY
jgi:hypothetical protein